MSIVKATIKGQVIIPAPIRKKYKIEKGSLLHIYEEHNKIVLEALPADPVAAGRGMLKSRGKVLKSLLRDRRQEAKQ
ncbi:MAG: AbrB/MazE/SpoVT family DNA-binding domain-containing protein [Desulfobacterota bacterium]|jgi:AbrB family looped-hinge helix DNA binding protein|nr:AbrB/MazE/SpoVT family DNA-binding domain-containing protein [Thermodesulfobacteriota bacterium]